MQEQFGIVNRTYMGKPWTSGPWDEEPDRIEWRDETTGYPCLIKRNQFGALCGYVGVSPGHPLYQRGEDDADWVKVAGDYLDVHGGITYTAMCSSDIVNGEEQGICHIPQEGEADEVWWFGFDCAHAGDLNPAWKVAGISMTDFESYRNVGYVKKEIEQLAAQLSAQEKIG